MSTLRLFIVVGICASVSLLSQQARSQGEKKESTEDRAGEREVIFQLPDVLFRQRGKDLGTRQTESRLYGNRSDRSTNAVAYANRGMIWEAKGELDKAEKDCTEAIRLKPNEGMFYGYRGLVRKEKGNIDDAIEDYSNLSV